MEALGHRPGAGRPAGRGAGTEKRRGQGGLRSPPGSESRFPFRTPGPSLARVSVTAPLMPVGGGFLDGAPGGLGSCAIHLCVCGTQHRARLRGLLVDVCSMVEKRRGRNLHSSLPAPRPSRPRHPLLSPCYLSVSKAPSLTRILMIPSETREQAPVTSCDGNGGDKGEVSWHTARPGRLTPHAPCTAASRGDLLLRHLSLPH